MGGKTSENDICRCGRYTAPASCKYSCHRFGKGRQGEPDISTIASMEPVFSGFRTIQANKDIHRSTLLDMTVKGQMLRHELDSIIAIPVKNREDSMRIILKYRQLENIVKSIKNNDNP